jgi:hypothetical protein
VSPAPDRAAIGPQTVNPAYRPEPKPWTERWPWVIYLVLGTASLLLLILLGLLAREASPSPQGTGENLVSSAG